MDMQAAINAMLAHQDLSEADMKSIMQSIMTGQATAAQIGGFLIGLRMKGETIQEITAAAKVMRTLSTKVSVEGDHLVDTCGTGGDGLKTFNISTAGAIVAAAAGANVAKHGNRSISSKSGSADVLEAAGVNLDLTPSQVAQCIDKIGVGFMFAPLHHAAMKHAIGPRKEMAVRTIFNILGPLTNPAGAPNHVLGVFSPDLLEPMVRVLENLGAKHVMVVHANDGLDEITVNGETAVSELNDGRIRSYKISPQQFGIDANTLEDIKVEDSQQSLALINAVFDNSDGTAKDIVILNAGATCYVAGLTKDLHTGIQLADEVIASGKAKQKFADLISLTQSFS
ncbi:MAG: anthranilate phosphoribosyltransferase [Thiohalomonadales bacterium]